MSLFRFYLRGGRRNELETSSSWVRVTRMEIAGGSPPAEIKISKSPDRLQTEISVTSTEMAGRSPPADIDICYRERYL